MFIRVEAPRVHRLRRFAHPRRGKCVPLVMTRASFITVCALALACALATNAAAAGWSRPASFDATAGRSGEPTPRVAIAPDGTAAATWTKGPSVLVATGDRRGRFSAPRRVGAWRASPPAVAAGPRGAALAAWEASDGVRVALRTGTGHRWVIRRVASSTGSAINGLEVVHDPRGGWVLAERQYPRTGTARPYRVRALTLERDGAPVGAPQDLGLGEFGIDAR